MKGYYWPDGVPREKWAKTYIQAIETEGFTLISASELHPERHEENFDKIVVFQKGGVFKHVARQISADIWASKLGDFEDTTHPLGSIAGGSYGHIHRFLRRAKRPWSVPAEYLVSKSSRLA